MMSECPDGDRLELVLKTDTADAELAKHLGSCAKCRQQLGELAGEEELPKPRGQQPATSPVLQRAMHQLKTEDGGQPAGFAIDPALSSGAAPERFGDYEILEELGRGGMGVVYRARQRSLNRDVALKLILAGQLASPAEVRRFRTEAEAAAMLDHPNIVPIYEISEHEGRHYFSMKFVDGQPLSDCLTQVRAWKSFRDIAMLAANVARAVHYAHQRGVLHRDLKPANILLDAQGQPHLTDFGLAKLMERDHGLTHSNAIMGTPNYMAPEVAAGKTKEVTTAADLHSLGAILYELLTGQRPFHAETVGATLQQVLTAEPRRPRLLNPAVPRDLETIALKCLEKEPAARYPSAATLAEELDRFARGEPIMARPVSAPERLWRWSRRKPALASALAALHVVLALGLAGIITQWRRAENHARNERQQRERAECAVFQSEMNGAQMLLESGNTAQGLAQLAMQLRERPTNRVVAERLLNALAFRAFSLPIAHLRHEEPLHTRGLEQFHFDGVVTCVNFSRDGRNVVSAGRDGTARVWDAQMGYTLAPPLRHKAEVRWADFDREGGRIITASMDGTAQVWDVRTGDSIRGPLQHRGAVVHAGFSDDGKWVITASDDGTAQVWDADSGQPAGPPLQHERAVYFAAFSPDAAYILTAERDGPGRLWERATGEFISDVDHQFRKEIPRPFPSFSPTGKSVAGFRQRAASLWTVSRPLTNLGRFEHQGEVTTMDFSSDGRWLTTASHDGTVRAWDLTKESIYRSFRHDQGIASVDISEDGKWLLTGSRDRTARLWDLETGRSLGEPLRHADMVFVAGLNASNRRIATLSGTGGAWLWQICSQAPTPIICRHQGGVTVARFDPTGRRILAAGPEAALLFEATSGRKLAELVHGAPQQVLEATFAGDGRIATGTDRGNTVLWTSDGQRMGPPLHPENAEIVRHVRSLSFGGRGDRLLVTGHEGGVAHVWNTESRSFVPLVHKGRLNCARFRKDGQLIVTASWDGTAQLWEAETGRAVQAPFQHERPVDWADFDGTGERVATASKDKQIRLWSTGTGKLLTQPLRHADSFAEKHPFDFSPDGTLLATAAGPALQIWTTATGQTLTASLKQRGRLNSVRFSPDGERVVIACDDGTAQIHDARTGHVLSEPLRHDGPVTYAEFSPDGRHVLTCSKDGTVKIWPILPPPIPAPDWLAELAEALAGEQRDGDGQSRSIGVETLYRLREKLMGNSGAGFYERWAAWFFSNPATREAWPK